MGVSPKRVARKKEVRLAELAANSADDHRTPLWRRLAPLALIAALAAFGFWRFGHLLSFETIAANRDALVAWRDSSYALAALGFIALYALVVALSIPGALWMTLTGGFLFGLWPGVLFNVAAASLGAIVIFVIARSSLGDLLRERAGPWLSRLERGFREDEASWLLMLRLVPAAPFFVANIAPALLGARLKTYVWTTVLGILPGALVYTWIGAGLGAALDRGEAPDLGILLEPYILGPILSLAALAALPIVVKRLNRDAGRKP